MGTPAVTTRGMLEKDMDVIADFLVRGVKIAKRIQDKAGKKLTEFNPAAEADEEIKQIREEVKAFATKFSIPGI